MQFSHCEKLQGNSRVSCELVTSANSDGGTRIVGDYTLPELRCPKSGLMGLLHRSKVAKVAPGHCSTRWARLVLPGGHGAAILTAW